MNWEKVTLQLLAIFSARGKYVALSSAPTKKSSLPYFLVIFPCHIFVPYFLAIFPCHICVPYFLAIFLSEGNILRFICFIQEVFSTAGLLSSSIDAMNTFLTDVSRCLPLLPSLFRLLSGTEACFWTQFSLFLRWKYMKCTEPRQMDSKGQRT